MLSSKSSQLSYHGGRVPTRRPSRPLQPAPFVVSAVQQATLPQPATELPQESKASHRIGVKFDDVYNLTPDNYNHFFAEAGRDVVLVDFYTDFCGPCKIMRGELEKLTGIFKAVHFAKFDMAKYDGGDFANRLSIRSLPTIRIFKGGRIVDEVRGARPAVLRQMLVHHNRPVMFRPLEV